MTGFDLTQIRSHGRNSLQIYLHAEFVQDSTFPAPLVGGCEEAIVLPTDTGGLLIQPTSRLDGFPAGVSELPADFRATDRYDELAAEHGLDDSHTTTRPPVAESASTMEDD